MYEAFVIPPHMGSGFKGKCNHHKITSADNNCTTVCSSQGIKSLLNFHIPVPNLGSLFIQKRLICISFLSKTSIFLYTTQEHTWIFLKIIYTLFGIWIESFFFICNSSLSLHIGEKYSFNLEEMKLLVELVNFFNSITRNGIIAINFHL